ncbi:MAG: HTTM domain-containing protein [Planctomycetota bacterium]|nr:HTTM domain-containing protein [Planctomycetota bacterium]
MDSQKNIEPGHSSDGIRARLLQPLDIASLVAFRIFLGASILFETLRYWIDGNLKSYYIDAPFHFKFYGFSWVERMPEPLMNLVFLLTALSALGVLVGYRHRISSILLFVTFTYTFLLDAATYRNHFYLLSLLSLLMIFLPAGRYFSMDASRKPEIRSTHCPAWCIWLLRFQIGVVYFFAGVAKFDPGWIAGESLRMIFISENHSPDVLAFLFREPVLYFFVWSGLLFDLTIPFFLLWKPTRVPAFLAAAGFHLTNGLFLVSVGIFPWFMLAASTIFFESNWPRVALRRIGFVLSPVIPMPTRAPSTACRWSGVLAGFLWLYVIVQISMPLRHHLYSGYTSWTHEGHRWSWRMKLVAKRTDAMEFFTIDPDKGTRIKLDALRILYPWQQDVMSRQPDLVLQFARDIHANLLKKTGKSYPIHAEIQVSLNGAPAHLFVDPEVDLAQVEWSLAAKPWIMPYRGK